MGRPSPVHLLLRDAAHRTGLWSLPSELDGENGAGSCSVPHGTTPGITLQECSLPTGQKTVAFLPFASRC